jgi:hypothetical protein
MTRMTRCRLTILHLLQIRLTDARTFIGEEYEFVMRGARCAVRTRIAHDA